MRTETKALYVSVASVVVSIAIGVGNYLTAAHQLDVAKQQLQASGPDLKAKATLWIYDSGHAKWTEIDVNRNVTRADDEAGNVVLRVEVTNEGRFQATVSQLGLGLSETTWETPKINCVNDEESIAECKMPRIIAPQGQALFYVDLDSPSTKVALTCNKYVQNGIEYIVQSIGSPLIVQRLPKSIYYASDCK